jgi:hypothetical protein
LLPDDPLGNARPVTLRYGIHNFDFMDRRLISNNQWRNTANTFQGFHGIVGQACNDWQFDFLAVQPLNRLKYGWDRPGDPRYLYGVIGNWRGWSDIVTIQPFYMQLRQSQSGTTAEKLVHTPGVRLYGEAGKTGLDFDFDLSPQFGDKHPLPARPGVVAPSQSRTAERGRAFAATAEVGYTCKTHDWKPRLSFFYGYASGDRRANRTLTGSPGAGVVTDATDNRFERLYGFQRPWSASDYIVWENISTPRLRLAVHLGRTLDVEASHAWFFLASGTDRFLRADAGRGTGRDFHRRA